jgi:hypothetical protein
MRSKGRAAALKRHNILPADVISITVFTLVVGRTDMLKTLADQIIYVDDRSAGLIYDILCGTTDMQAAVSQF